MVLTNVLNQSHQRTLRVPEEKGTITVLQVEKIITASCT